MTKLKHSLFRDPDSDDTSRYGDWRIIHKPTDDDPFRPWFYQHKDGRSGRADDFFTAIDAVNVLGD